jgi:hypothetical protein
MNMKTISAHNSDQIFAEASQKFAVRWFSCEIVLCSPKHFEVPEEICKGCRVNHILE